MASHAREKYCLACIRRDQSFAQLRVFQLQIFNVDDCADTKLFAYDSHHLNQHQLPFEAFIKSFQKYSRYESSFRYFVAVLRNLRRPTINSDMDQSSLAPTSEWSSSKKNSSSPPVGSNPQVCEHKTVALRRKV